MADVEGLIGVLMLVFGFGVPLAFIGLATANPGGVTLAGTALSSKAMMIAGATGILGAIGAGATMS